MSHDLSPKWRLFTEWFRPKDPSREREFLQCLEENLTWGGIHALFFIPLFLRGTNRKNNSDIVSEGKWLPAPRELLQMGWTFTAVTIAWIFFRADSLTHAFTYLQHPFENLFYGGVRRNGPAILAICLLVTVDFICQKQHTLKWFKSRIVRILAYGFIAALVALRFEQASASFIYFQF